MNHYTQLLYFLKQLAESHPLVNTVTQGNADNIDLEKSNIFPLVHLTIEDANFTNGKTLVFPVTIECLTERDFNKEVIDNKFWKQDNEVDNHNETLAILNYMWTALYRDWNQNNLTTTEDATVTKIEFARGNVLDGWSLSFEVEVPNTDLCLELVPDEITVTLSSTTGGTATSSLGGDGDSPFTVDKNTNVAFSATPETGYRFRYWLLNNIQNLTNPLALIITKSYDVVANFIKTWTLTTSVSGNGTISPLGANVYDTGTAVDLTVTPDPENEIDRVEEDGVPISAPYQVTVDADKSVVAYFQSILTTILDVFTTIPTNNIAVDSSGFNNDLTYINLQSASFSYVNRPTFNRTGFDFSSVDTIVFRSKFIYDNTGKHWPVYAGGNSATTKGFSVYKNEAVFELYVGNGSAFVKKTIAHNTWGFSPGDIINIEATLTLNGNISLSVNGISKFSESVTIGGFFGSNLTIRSVYLPLTANAIVMQTEIEGYFKLRYKEGSGNDVFDISGNGNHFTATTNPIDWNSFEDDEPLEYINGFTNNSGVVVLGLDALTTDAQGNAIQYPRGSGIISVLPINYEVPENLELNEIIPSGTYTWAQLDALTESENLIKTKANATTISQLIVKKNLTGELFSGDILSLTAILGLNKKL